MSDAALSFGQAAARYDRVRPSYPAAAVRQALGDPPARVVDLGAGTGLLTRVLLAEGFEVIPVEPDEGMRAHLAVMSPTVTALAGSAERIPLPDASVDCVVAGQAYHWFDRDRAHREMARVLRPGGVFAAIWNTRDESVPWVPALTRAAHLGDGPAPERRIDDLGPLFGPVRRVEFRHATVHTGQSLVDLIRSRSYYLTAPADRQAEIESAVRDVVSTIGQDTFELPYVTETYWAFRTSLTSG